MPTIAIYARKSVFREDSISVESQIEQCIYEAKGENYVIYQDNGFSGKNTDRPDYQRMLKDIMDGKITKVIVYKLDRISRSVLDFARMMDTFQKYNIAFISATEHFDTSSPMGRAMLNICIVFAQLERETIQQRVADSYSSRCKKGFFMGGRTPYGYRIVPFSLFGKKTSMYEIVEEEAKDIRSIYEMYSKPETTLGDVLRYLKAHDLNLNKRGHYWNTARLSETMRNPAYTFADMNIYNFFKEKKSEIVNSPELFTGETSLYLYSGENTNRKTWDLERQIIVIAPHFGIVDSDTWLSCRKKLLSNHQIRFVKAKNSFLAGKVKCGHCGYALTIRRSARRRSDEVRYYIDSGKSSKACNVQLPTLRGDEFEAKILEMMNEKVNSLNLHPKEQDNKNDARLIAIEENERLVAGIDEKINNLLETITNSCPNQKTIEYINKKISELDKNKNEILCNSEKLKSELRENEENKPNTYKKIKNIMDKWEETSFDEKRRVVNLLINVIRIYSNDIIDIEWKV